MYSNTWKTSPREFEVAYERTTIEMPDGIKLDAQIWRPDAAGEFPAILGYHPYQSAPQTAPITPGPIAAVGHFQPGQESGNGWIEAGDPTFYARRGYVYVLVNIRGTSASEGVYEYLGEDEIQDGHRVVEWIAEQPWCEGSVGMFGVSYFARIQYFVAMTKPPHLKCLFAPWGSSDQFRDVFYQGGILNKDWPIYWGKSSLRETNYRDETLNSMTADELDAALAGYRNDPDIMQDADLAAVLADPLKPSNQFIASVMVNNTYNDFWKRRTVDYSKIDIPVYTGSDWLNYGLHLPSAFRAWEGLQSAPKRMIIGPQAYLDRPLSQMQYESLRWYDKWLKGVDTGWDDEKPISLFIPGSGGKWKHADEWPLPETKWTPFYLHEKGRLWEREHFPNEGSSTYSDSPWGRESVEFQTPQFVEETEIVGPMSLKLYASTTSDDALFFVSVRAVALDGTENILTRGWLRASHRSLDAEKSTPWAPYHSHEDVRPVEPGAIEQYDIPIVPTAYLFKPGMRLKVKIAGADDPGKNSLENIAAGHIRRRVASRVTVYHNTEYPSELLVPVTSGNILGTYLSGGQPYITFD